jgi:uncharacterized membrane protein
MIEQDATADATETANTTDATLDAETIADESTPEDVATQIVPQAQLTPLPATPQPSPQPPTPGARGSGAPRRPSGVPAAPHSPFPAGGAWPGSQGRQGQPSPHVMPVVGGQQAAAHEQPTHAPYHTATSWGTTTFVITAETAAGFSYLFWWVSGLLVYFNERDNRYVRFHAVQSILLTGTLSVFSVVAFLIASLFNTLFLSNHQPIWQALALWTIVLWLLIVLFVWIATMVAAWTGSYLRLPLIGDYAERFAAPPIQLRP